MPQPQLSPGARIYLAGPDVFYPDAPAIAAYKKERCSHHGFIGLDPLDQEPAGPPNSIERGLAIYHANMGLMRRADAIIANLTPFRGPSADPGAVFELGFMLGQGKPAFAYSANAALFHARTVNIPGSRAEAGVWFDANGAEIEDFGLTDNLMIDAALRTGALPIQVASPSEAALDAFERCLIAAAG